MEEIVSVTGGKTHKPGALLAAAVLRQAEHGNTNSSPGDNSLGDKAETSRVWDYWSGLGVMSK